MHALKSPFETEGLLVFAGHALRTTCKTVPHDAGRVRMPLYF